MHFAFFIGEGYHINKWKSVLDAFSGSIGNAVEFELNKLDENRFCGKAFNPITASIDPNYNHVFFENEKSEPCSKNAVRISFSAQNRELAIRVPILSCKVVFYSEDPRGIMISDDLRLMIKWNRLVLDERAVYSLFQYNSVLPPFTLSQNIKRLPNGWKLFTKNNMSKICIAPDPALEFSPEIYDDHEKTVTVALDRILEQIPSHSVLFFSGGVDSSLLAARLSILGRRDLTLLNYSFGPHDSEGRLAQTVAEHLKMPFVQIMHDPKRVPDILDGTYRDYSFPFGDYATIPSNLMVKSLLASYSGCSLIIDGSGADQTFGLYKNYAEWKLIYHLPSFIRYGMSKGFENMELWKKETDIEKFIQKIRLSQSLPTPLAWLFAKNSFDGILYTTPEHIRQSLIMHFENELLPIVKNLEPVSAFSILGLFRTSNLTTIPKYFDPLYDNGISLFSPFMETDFMKLSLCVPWKIKCKNGEAKSLLKQILCRQLPVEMVRRPKHGFTPPLHEIFRDRRLQEYLRNSVFRSDNQLYAYLHHRTFEDMKDKIYKGQMISKRCYEFFWTFVFVSIWIKQMSD